MGQFHHPNVVKLHGVVTMGEPVSYRCVWSIYFIVLYSQIMIVLEYMPLGDMREYLHKMAPM